MSWCSILHAGLDARAAAIVMRVVRNIVDTGRTITCTVHQPSIEIFEVGCIQMLLHFSHNCNCTAVGKNKDSNGA